MDNIIAAFELIGFLIAIVWVLTGALVWLRYGFDGAHFVWSKQFPDALLTWMAENRLRRMKEEDDADAETKSINPPRYR